VHAGPGAVGPPRLRDFGEGAAGPVPFGDLGVKPSFVAGQRVGGVRATDHDQLFANGGLLARLRCIRALVMTIAGGAASCQP